MSKRTPIESVSAILSSAQARIQSIPKRYLVGFFFAKKLVWAALAVYATQA